MWAVRRNTFMWAASLLQWLDSITTRRRNRNTVIILECLLSQNIPFNRFKYSNKTDFIYSIDAATWKSNKTNGHWWEMEFNRSERWRTIKWWFQRQMVHDLLRFYPLPRLVQATLCEYHLIWWNWLKCFCCTDICPDEMEKMVAVVKQLGNDIWYEPMHGLML